MRGLMLTCLAMVFVSAPGIGHCGVAPNEVILFSDVHYVGQRQSFRLSPGMRFRQVRALGSFNDKTSSIMVGNNVAVVVFQNVNFGGFYYETFYGNIPVLSKRRKGNDNWNDSISSLMVIPKQMGSSWKESGVFLYGKDQKFLGPGYVIQRFFPLAENAAVQQAHYRRVGDDLNDKANVAIVGTKVRTLLYQNANFGGKSLELPGAVAKKSYTLGSYNFAGKVSSLVVMPRATYYSPGLPSPGGPALEEPGPPSRGGPGGGKSHRAPPAP